MFYRRDRAGNWTQYPPDPGWAGTSEDLVTWGDKTYWSHSNRVHTYDGTTWDVDSALDWEGNVRFTVHDGVLYAAGGQVEVWRRARWGFWIREENVGAPWSTDAISIGDDGALWLGADDGGGNARVYVRQGSHWTLHSTAAGVEFHSACAYEGALYAGADVGGNAQFWAYAPDFAIAPGGLPPQAMDVDGDGGALYVCAYNAAAQPILVKVGLPLVNHAVGAAVFGPAAGGSAINVQCTNLGGELAISGRLSAGGNDSVQVSDDGAASWSDVAPAWGDSAQPLVVSPDSIDEILVCLAGAQDIVWTTDGGGTWTVMNPAVGYAPDAMVRMRETDELVIGDAHAARKVEYSPNLGVEIQDITGGAAIGDVVALQVASHP